MLKNRGLASLSPPYVCWNPGAPFGEGTANFQVMREWNRSEVVRKVMHYFAERLGGR